MNNADFLITEKDWEFLYIFSKQQLFEFLCNSHFEIVEEFAKFSDEGILHNFGRIAGVYNYEHEMVSLSWVGRILRKVLPVETTDHMICYLVKKNN